MSGEVEAGVYSFTLPIRCVQIVLTHEILLFVSGLSLTDGGFISACIIIIKCFRGFF